MALDKKSKIFVAGHHGLVGSAIWNNLKKRGYDNLVGKSHAELDLLDPVAVKKFFDEEQPDAVVLAAAHVGGIMANLQYRADFIYQNLQIQQNIIGEAWKHGVKKLLFLGSTCIYPGEAPQPMPEDCLLTSPLEYTNEPYAIAKIAGLKMCESFNLQYGTNYIAVMPTNLYGPNDNFHLENSHVLPAMIRKIHLAKCLNTRFFKYFVIMALLLKQLPVGEQVHRCVSSFGVKRWQTPPFIVSSTSISRMWLRRVISLLTATASRKSATATSMWVQERKFPSRKWLSVSCRRLVSRANSDGMLQNQMAP